ncbi:MAG: UDP-N-acetylmuramate--L-alanine ligase [Bacillota bacterium]
MAEKHIHLIGIGGISMSGIAKLLLINDYKVSGSDIKYSKVIERLKKNGAKISIGHDSNNIKRWGKPDSVVISSAIGNDNPELKMAKKFGINILKRAEMIAKLMNDKKTIAVSGTHGKTTTTGLIASLLQNNKNFDPTIMLGGNLDILDGNIHVGKGEYFITEADESDGSLLYFDPYLTVVTNIELEHLDYYTNEKKLLDTFNKFILKTDKRGKAIVCAEDKTINKLVDLNNNDILTYGFKNGKIQAKNIKSLPFGSLFDVEFNNKKIGEINLQIPGSYNILNSLAAISVGLYLGMSFTAIKKGIEKFSGVKRRFEKKGLIDDVLVIDDYAHHPTEIKETLKAATNTGFNRVIAVFQPHRYSRTKYLFEEFCNSFSNADRLIITDIYSANEKVENEEDKLLAEKMADKCSRIYDYEVSYIEKLKEIPDFLNSIIKSRDIVITIGAGDIYKSGEKLIELLKKDY